MKNKNMLEKQRKGDDENNMNFKTQSMINYIADEARAISNEILQWFWTFVLGFLEFVVLFCLPQSRRTPVSVKEQRVKKGSVKNGVITNWK